MRTSSLETSGARFLSICLQFALEEGWLSPADLNEEFSAEQLMTALEGASDLRARLLVEAAGVHEKIAPKKSTSAAAEDLQIALDEGLCWRSSRPTSMSAILRPAAFGPCSHATSSGFRTTNAPRHVYST